MQRNFYKIKKTPKVRPRLFETSEIKELGFIPNSFFMATLCRERYLTREEMKTQYKKAEKRKRAKL